MGLLESRGRLKTKRAQEGPAQDAITPEGRKCPTWTWPQPYHKNPRRKCEENSKEPPSGCGAERESYTGAKNSKKGKNKKENAAREGARSGGETRKERDQIWGGDPVSFWLKNVRDADPRKNWQRRTTLPRSIGGGRERALKPAVYTMGRAWVPLQAIVLIRWEEIRKEKRKSASGANKERGECLPRSFDKHGPLNSRNRPLRDV